MVQPPFSDLQRSSKWIKSHAFIEITLYAGRVMYQFSIAVITHYHKISYLTQYKCIILQFRIFAVQHGSHLAKIRVEVELLYLLEALWENHFPCLSRLQRDCLHSLIHGLLSPSFKVALQHLSDQSSVVASLFDSHHSSASLFHLL